MARTGRPSKYDAALHVPLIHWMARTGLTDAEMATHLDVHRSTLARWKQRQPDLRDTEQAGKAVIDRAVEAVAFRRAVGYDFEERTYELVDGKMRMTKRVEKHQPGDVGALIWWLKNRLPGEWRDRKDVHVTPQAPVHDLSQLSDDELELAIRLSEKAANDLPEHGLN
tara:strand:- start:915 stop:1418 length:504 start_codon:yes stop_codon:yes gene_type:complete